MNPSRQAQANFELILSQLKVLCKGVGFPKKKSRRGRKPDYSDKFILKLVIIQRLPGFTSERSFLRFVPELKCPEFEYLPDHSQYNRRAKRLKPLIEKLTLRINKTIRIDKSKVRILDTTSVPLLRMSRVKNRKIFTDKRQAAIGYCAAQKTHYFGLKLNLFVNKEGIPCFHDLKPANRSDIRCLEEILTERKKISGIVLVGDKGYISDFNKSWFRQCWQITLITPYRRNQKKINTKKEKKPLKSRGIIETIIGQIKDQMVIEKLRAKTYAGAEARINNIIFAYLFGVYINKLYKRNPLNLKSLLM